MEEQTMRPYGVYIKTDEADRIVAIHSDAFLEDLAGWTRVDEGFGDRYHHAQGNYLDKPLTDGRGVYRYRLDGGKIAERSAAEMDADAAKLAVPPTQAERIAALEKDAQLLLETAGDQEYRLCLMELGVSDGDL